MKLKTELQILNKYERMAKDITCQKILTIVNPIGRTFFLFPLNCLSEKLIFKNI